MNFVIALILICSTLIWVLMGMLATTLTMTLDNESHYTPGQFLKASLFGVFWAIAVLIAITRMESAHNE